MNNELIKSINYRGKGFTLLELLVVLAIIGIMVGVAIFFSAPSTTETGRKLGGQTFDLMNKARISAMLERRIYGLEVLDDIDETEIRLVVLEGEISYADNASLSDVISDDNDDFLDGRDDLDDELTIKISYTDHKAKAQSLGLLNWESDAQWVILSDREAVIIPESIRLDFSKETILVEEAYIPSREEELDEELEEEFLNDISPVLLFFPDGHLSNAGNVEFISAEGDIVYSFRWNRVGEFERIQ